MRIEYGDWTIIGKSPKKGYVMAQCKCGTTREVLINNLRSGRSESCGCKKMPIKYFSTQYIEVLYPTKDNKYMCRCNKCRKNVEMTEERIRRKPKSCGCGLRKESVYPDECMNGYRIIAILPSISGKKRVLAKCQFCGKERTLRLSSLRNNKTTCVCRM